MRKNFTFMLLFLQGVLGVWSQEKTVTVVIDDVSRVRVVADYDNEFTEAENGANQVNCNSTVSFYPKEGCKLIEVKTRDGNWEGTEFINPEGYCEVRPFGGEVYTVTSSRNDDVRTASCTITVDNTDKVKVERTSLEGSIELTNGENLFKFDPATESELKITPLERKLYRVTLDGTDITATSDWAYTVAIRDGSTLNIQAEYPEITYPVHITLEGDEAQDFIQYVDVDGEPVFDYMDEDFAVNAGAELQIQCRTNEYEVLSCTINGQAYAGSFNPFTHIVSKETAIHVRVRKWATFKVTVNVDDPTRVKAYRGHYQNGDELQLVAGENIVNVQRTTPAIAFIPEEGHYIESLEIADYAYTREELQKAPVIAGALTDNEVITLTTGVINRDKKGMLFISGMESASDYFEALRADGSRLENLTEGYNTFDFYEYDNEFTFKTGGPVRATLYLNEQKQNTIYEGSYNYMLDLSDRDVVKIFFGNEIPESYEVSFSLNELKAEDVEVTRDRIVSVNDYASGFWALQKTEVAVKPKDGVEISVHVNGQQLAANDENACVFAVNERSEVVVSRQNISSDMDWVCSERQLPVGRIYNVWGVVVAEEATPQSIAALSAGVYIIDGKKFIKR